MQRDPNTAIFLLSLAIALVPLLAITTTRQKGAVSSSYMAVVVGIKTTLKSFKSATANATLCILSFIKLSVENLIADTVRKKTLLLAATFVI